MGKSSTRILSPLKVMQAKSVTILRNIPVLEFPGRKRHAPGEPTWSNARDAETAYSNRRNEKDERKLDVDCIY